jgi:hypothetical protein
VNLFFVPESGVWQKRKEEGQKFVRLRLREGVYRLGKWEGVYRLRGGGVLQGCHSAGGGSKGLFHRLLLFIAENVLHY